MMEHVTEIDQYEIENWRRKRRQTWNISQKQYYSLFQTNPTYYGGYEFSYLDIDYFPKK
jgi:hypothetical protein